MKLHWFKRIAIFFIPVSIIGWLFLIGALYYAVHIFIVIDSRSHSISDTLRNFIFNLIIIGSVYSLIALLTNSTDNKKQLKNQ